MAALALTALPDGLAAQTRAPAAGGGYPAEVTTTLVYSKSQTHESGVPNVPLCQKDEWQANLQLRFRRTAARGLGVEYEAVDGRWDATGSCTGEMTWQRSDNPPEFCTWTTSGTSRGSGTFTPGGESRASLTLYPDGTYQIAFYLDEITQSRTWSNPCRTSGSTTGKTPLTGSAENVTYTLRGGQLALAPQGARESFNETANLRALHRWTVGAASGAGVRVAIEGPACGCMDAEKPEGDPLHYTAKASVPGGTFTRFAVVSSGDAPREIRNTAGSAPELQLAARPGTRSLTLRVTYAVNGAEHSAEQVVNLCAMDSISLPDGEDLAFSGDPEGRLEVKATSGATLNGAPVTQHLRWTLQQMGSGTREETVTGTGGSAILAYVGLPEHNSAFGEKRIEAELSRDGCECRRSRKFRAFFRGAASNHPGAADDRLPNFMYYWLQTAAGQNVPASRVRYVRGMDDGSGGVVAGRADDDEGLVLMSDAARTRDCYPRHDPATRAPTGQAAPKGIDCFAETLRHEWAHVTEYRLWWPDGYSMASDLDLDGVPNTVEAATPGCSATSQRSCTGRPLATVSDREFQAYWIGWTWPIGSADKEDWSTCGRQWNGRGANCAGR